MFDKVNPGNTYYYGSDTYKHIDDLIRRGHEVLLVSPYVDKYYANMILERSAGRRFYLISSSIDDDALKMLQGGSRLWIIWYIALSIISLSILLFIGIYDLRLLLSLVPIIIGIIRNMGKGSSVILKIPRRFVHAKMYISEGMAITGSVNLTYKGTHRNVEQINITYNKDNIARLTAQFWELWSRL